MDFGEFVGVAGDEVEIFWWHFFEFFGGFLPFGRGIFDLMGFFLGISWGCGEWMGEGVVGERLGFGKWDEMDRWKSGKWKGKWKWGGLPSLAVR